MKKILGFLCILLGLGLFFGCDDDDVKDVLVPKKKWCELTISFSGEKGGTTADREAKIYMYYSDEPVKLSSVSGARSDLYVDEKGNVSTISSGSPYEIGGGLTIIIQPMFESGESNIGGMFSDFANGQFICKSFKAGEEIDFDDDNSSSLLPSEFSGNMDETKWMGIYNIVKAKGSDKFKKDSGLPTVLSDSARTLCSPASWENVKNTFSWKTILANYLLS